MAEPNLDDALSEAGKKLLAERNGKFEDIYDKALSFTKLIGKKSKEPNVEETKKVTIGIYNLVVEASELFANSNREDFLLQGLKVLKDAFNPSMLPERYSKDVANALQGLARHLKTPYVRPADVSNAVGVLQAHRVFDDNYNSGSV